MLANLTWFVFRSLVLSIGVFLFLDLLSQGSICLHLLGCCGLSLGIVAVFEECVGALGGDSGLFSHLLLLFNLRFRLLRRCSTILLFDSADKLNKFVHVRLSHHLVEHRDCYDGRSLPHSIESCKDTPRIVWNFQMEARLHVPCSYQRLLMLLLEGSLAAELRQKVKQNHVLVVLLHQLELLIKLLHGHHLLVILGTSALLQRFLESLDGI